MDVSRFEEVAVDSEAALWDWLAAHHGRLDSVWLVTWKRDSPTRYVSREAVLDALVAYGWIDGVRRKRDHGRTMQLISPRQQRAWAASYKTRAARLINDGRMCAPGFAAIAASKRAGLWHASDAVDALVVPDDLAAALELQPPAAGHFAAFAPSRRRNILRWIHAAKTAPTRAKRIAKTAALAAANRAPPHL